MSQLQVPGVCKDYRKLNDITHKHSYTLPRIDDSVEALSGARWFSTLDFTSGYWQVEMDKTDRQKTVFNSSKRSSEGFHSTIMYRISSPITSINNNRWLCTTFCPDMNTKLTKKEDSVMSRARARVSVHVCALLAIFS